MDSSANHLRTLGLTDEASLEEATAAYRDLIRVWHPDRFQGDPRLRRKAEEQTRLLNQAISFLRKALREPIPVRTRPTPTTAVKAQPRTGETYASRRGPSTFPKLRVHQTRRSSLYHLISGATLAALGAITLMKIEQSSPAQTVLGMVVIGYALSRALMGLALLCFTRPICSVDNVNLTVMGFPFIPLDFISNIWVSTSTTGTYLTVRIAKEYLPKLPLNLRLYFGLRYYLNRPHIRLRCNHLDIHPNHVVNTIKLAYEGDAVVASDLKALRRFQIPWHTLSLLCLIIGAARCFVEH